MDPTWADLYRHHFVQYFGKPFDVQRFQKDNDSPPLYLGIFDQRFRNYRIFASLGLTDYRDAVQDLGEAILLADDAWQDIPVIFVNSLIYMIQKRIPLGSRFAIGGVDNIAPAFAEHFGKTALYYTVADGFPEGFERLAWNHDVGLVYQAVFISESELDFLHRKGAAEFEERYRAQDADLCSLRRPPCV